MDEKTIQENQKIFEQIVQQFFTIKQVADFEKKHYVLEYGAQDRISIDTSDSKEIQRFIEGFFRTCVSQMKLHKENSTTLIVPCIFRYLDNTINNKSSSTTKHVEITIVSTIVPRLFKLYFTPKSRE